MGIRMKIAVGYGLDCKSIPGANMEALSWRRIGNKDAFTSYLDDFNSWLESKDPMECLDDFLVHTPKSFDELIIYDDEFGFDSKLLLIPAGFGKSWVRYDNHLDSFIYEAHTNPDKWGEPEWIEKPGILYPFVSLMRANSDKPLGVEKYWVSCYLDDPEHKDAIPFAPFHLWFLIKHLRLWPEEKTTEAFLSLRPTIYRYWS